MFRRKIMGLPLPLLLLITGWLHAQTQWGLVPSDLAMGAYTMAWKTTLDTAAKSTVSLRASIQTGNAALETEALGWQFDPSGMWSAFPGALTAEWSGWRLEGAYRQEHVPQYKGPRGVFAGAYGGVSRSRVTVQESAGVDLDEAVYGAFGQDVASHQMVLTTGAIGLELGWAKENASGWSWECFVSPVFMGLIRKYDADFTRWENEESLDQAMVNRLQTAYSAPWPMRPLYLMNVGPWVRAGVIFYRVPNQQKIQ